MHPIKRARLLADMKIAELARRAGVSRTTIYELESGSTAAQIATYRKVADALGVPIDQIAPKAPEPEPIEVRMTGLDGRSRRAFGTFEVEADELERVLFDVWEHRLEPPDAMRELIGAEQ